VRQAAQRYPLRERDHLVAQLGSEPIKLVSTDRQAAAWQQTKRRASRRPSDRQLGGSPACEPSRGLRCIQMPFWAMPK